MNPTHLESALANSSVFVVSVSFDFDQLEVYVSFFY